MHNRPPTFALALAVVVFCAARLARADDRIEKTVLFTAGEGDYALHRIPGIVRTKRGTLLAYCEARKSPGDWGRIDVMLRRSTDGGRTWEPARKVADPPAGASPNPATAARRRPPGDITVNNPVAIADDTTGAVHFLYCVEYERCFYLRSDDDGITFTDPVEITAAFEAFRPEYDWKVIATGPGHGIRLRRGRLVVPVWLSTARGRNAHHPSCVATIFSDDAGKTWKRGDIVAAPPALEDPSEAAAAELDDGRVMLNIRQEGNPGAGNRAATRRAVTTSPDGATRWDPVRLDDALPDPVCMAALVRSQSGLLFSNLDNPDDRRRRNLTVKLSPDGGRTWTGRLVLDPGSSGYSDLAVSDDGTAYCFYEGRETSDAGKDSACLWLARFDVKSLGATPAP